MTVHRFRFFPPTDAYMTREVGASISRVAVSHEVTADYEIPDVSLEAAIGVMLTPNNWEYVEASPPTLAAKTIAQIVGSSLAADASSIPVASGWVDVLTASVQTKGSCIFAVQFSAIGAPAMGEGLARLRINGGAFSDLVFGADSYSIPVLSYGVASGNAPKVVASTPGYTTYTVSLQMQATGVLGSVVPKKGSQLTVVEYR